MLTEALYPNNFRLIYDTASSCKPEFEYLCEYRASLYMALYISKAYCDFVKGYQDMSQHDETVIHLAKCLSSLQGNLESTEAATADSTISVIMSLARAAGLGGDV